MRDRSHLVARRLTWVFDLAILPLAGLLAFLAHDALRASWFPFLKPRAPMSEYLIVIYATAPVWLFLVSSLRLDRVFERKWTPLELTRDLLVQHVLGFVVLSSVLYLSQAILNRALLALFLFFDFALSFCGRSLLAHWFQRQYRRGLFRPTWLLVGTPGELMQRFLTSLEAEVFPPRVEGVLADEALPATGFPCPHLGPSSQLSGVLHERSVDLVVFFPPVHHAGVAEPMVHACEQVGVPTAWVVDHGQRYSFRPALQMVGATPLLSFDWTPPRDLQLAIKHLVDPLIAAAMLLVLWPVLLATTLAILVTMGRPVMFGQERVGLHGRRFKMWKFRSMVAGAEQQRDALLARNELSGPVFKVTDDPRITRLGHFLRKWSLDELPQLFNVLLGEMSLVGPRPLPSREQQGIEGWYRRRLTMRPGITGLWQVSGRSGIDFDEWMQLDLKYVDEWSLLLDLKLLAMTAPAVLARRGAK